MGGGGGGRQEHGFYIFVSFLSPHHNITDNCFFSSAVSLISSVWKCSEAVRKWKLCRPCSLFRDKYNEIEQLKAQVGCMDDLLTGMYIYIHACICTYNITIYGFHIVNVSRYALKIERSDPAGGSDFTCVG